jgi:glycosyltransferase involved in cell wall biosynthesis
VSDHRDPVLSPCSSRGQQKGADDSRHAPVEQAVQPKRLSVCLYTPSVDPSGMGGHMIDLAADYAHQLDVTVMAWATPGGRRLLDQAVSVGAHSVALPRPRDPGFAEVIVQALRARRVQIFHSHVGTGLENFDGARAARAAEVPVVLSTLHMPWLRSSLKRRRPFLQSIEPLDRVITVSAGQRRTYERIGVPPAILETIVNGIRPRGPGLGRTEARRVLGLTPNQPAVITVGRLMVQKGQKFLVQAVPVLLRTFPNLALVILGHGYLHDELRELADRLGVGQHVLLPGHRTDARLLLDAADVFVLPSRQEALPLALLEAMDAALPIVATQVMGISDVVVPGETGLLVPRDDPESLAQAITELLGDPDSAERLGDAARSRYLQSYTSQRMSTETLSLYRRLLTMAES